MARIDGTEDVEVPVSGLPMGSFPSSPYQPPNGNQFPAPNNSNFPAPIGNPWSTGLFDCNVDQTNAITTTILPCMTFGQIAEVLDEGEMSCPLGSFIYMLMMPALCSSWIMGSKYRAKLRKKYNLVEAPYEDAISHILCPCCSLCQEFRELRSRGLDPALGRNGILAQQQSGMRHSYSDDQQQVHNPPPHQAMSI